MNSLKLRVHVSSVPFFKKNFKEENDISCWLVSLKLAQGVKLEFFLFFIFFSYSNFLRSLFFKKPPFFVRDEQ